METVWDYNMTKEEIRTLTFPSRDEYEVLSEESADLDLYLLFSYRGEKEKAKVYFDRLSDEVRRPFTMQDEIDFKF